MNPKLFLKKDRDRSVRQRHPWIFSGAIGRIEGSPGIGETVDIHSAEGEFLGRAAYSPQSSIRARMWTWEDIEIGNDFLERRIQRAIEARQGLMVAENDDALRLIHAESDGLPGVVVDRYGDVLVLQCLTAGAERWRDVIVTTLLKVTSLDTIFERSDVDVRELEGLPKRSGVLHGADPADRIVIQENGIRFGVDVKTGQKTGFYLDQRHNRQRVRELVAGKSVLNCFCYTGGFSLYALAGGASKVVSVDSSGSALEIGRENMALNGFPGEKAGWMEGDVFLLLRRFRDEARKFDAIILDPPKFAPTAAQAEKAARAYKDINLLAFKLLNQGGLLFTFSCSGGISAELFQKIVAGAALDAKVDARIVETLSQGPDHPVALNFPEGAYLKGLVCQVI
ncbi:MAG TPA: class I SAM-dependent rRNA methyltransferase [Anaerolineaceae bacterium]|jgi:23S rRNA (cytosine1962-C5)-methyltransferase